MLFSSRTKTASVTPEDALPGRDHYIYAIPEIHIYAIPEIHEVLKTPSNRRSRTTWRLRSLPSAASGRRAAVLAQEGVWTTAVGYTGGYTPHRKPSGRGA